jgi:hypothetical protein
VLAVVVQATLLALLLAAAALVRGRLAAGVAIAAMAPVLFFETNRIFSPQFVLMMLAGWFVAAALLLRNRTEQLWVGLVAMALTLANAFVYPYALPMYKLTWQLCSTVLFALSLGLTGWVAARAISLMRTKPPAIEAR